MSTTTVNRNLGFKRDGTTHVALLIAKSLRRRFTVADLRAISDTKFVNPKRTSQSLCLLVGKGFLDKNSEGWIITSKGIEHLYRTAQQNKLADLGA